MAGKGRAQGGISGGARPGAGRKSNAVRAAQAANRSRLIGRLTDADFASLADSLLQRALSGDVQAARLILSYAAGSPEADLTVSDPDGGPMRVVVEYVDSVAEADA
jgi:hypothetical protein